MHMSNGQKRIYIDNETAEQIVESLDAARLRAQQDPNASGVLLQLCSVAQWIVHLPQFLPIHQRLWRERGEQ